MKKVYKSNITENVLLLKMQKKESILMGVAIIVPILFLLLPSELVSAENAMIIESVYESSIAIYGQVLDENMNPVENAAVQVYYRDDYGRVYVNSTKTLTEDGAKLAGNKQLAGYYFISWSTLSMYTGSIITITHERAANPVIVLTKNFVSPLLVNPLVLKKIAAKKTKEPEIAIQAPEIVIEKDEEIKTKQEEAEIKGPEIVVRDYTSFHNYQMSKIKHYAKISGSVKRKSDPKSFGSSGQAGPGPQPQYSEYKETVEGTIKKKMETFSSQSMSQSSEKQASSKKASSFANRSYDQYNEREYIPVQHISEDKEENVKNRVESGSTDSKLWIVFIVMGFELLVLIAIGVLIAAVKGSPARVKAQVQRKIEAFISRKAKDIMNENVYYVSGDESVLETMKIMDKKKVQGVCVINKNRLMGIITEEEILKNIDKNTGISTLKVKDIMQKEVITATTSSTVYTLGSIIKEQHARKVPILFCDQVVGIVTQSDILNALSSDELDRISSIKSMPKVLNIVRRNIVDIELTKSASEIISIMRKKRVSSIILVKGKDPVAVFTDRDYLKYLLDTKTTSITRFISSPVISITPDKDIIEALHVMNLKDCRRLLVKDADRTIGIITKTDIFNMLHSYLYEITSEKFKRKLKG